jgi:hypothetical protein
MPTGPSLKAPGYEALSLRLAPHRPCMTLVIDQLNGSYFLPDTIHDFVAVMYVIAKTPECTDRAISLHDSRLQDYHLTDILSNKDGKLQVRSLRLDRCNKLTTRNVIGLFSRASPAFYSLEYGAVYNYTILILPPIYIYRRDLAYLPR